jgi:hypothetical protein
VPPRLYRTGAPDLTTLGLAQLRSSPVFPLPLLSLLPLTRLFARIVLLEQPAALRSRSSWDRWGNIAYPFSFEKSKALSPFEPRRAKIRRAPMPPISRPTLSVQDSFLPSIPLSRRCSLRLNTAVSILVCFAVFAVLSSLRSSFRTNSSSLHLPLDKTPAATVSHKTETYHLRPPEPLHGKGRIPALTAALQPSYTSSTGAARPQAMPPAHYGALVWYLSDNVRRRGDPALRRPFS